MIALIVLPIIGAYLVAFFLVVRYAVRSARRKGRSGLRAGLIAGLLMYLPVFWDFIPTVLLHQYLCATEQGIWIYKTVEQWQQENPGVAETLTWSSLSEFYEAPGVIQGMILNQRFSWERRIHNPSSILPVRVTEELIVDRKNDESVAKLITIGSGHSSPLVHGGVSSWKIWLKMPTCRSGAEQFAKYLEQVKRQGEMK